MTVFNHECHVPNQMKLANYGKRWSDAEVDKLAQHLKVGADMDSISVQMQRPADGIRAKAMQHNFLCHNLNDSGEDVYTLNYPAILTRQYPNRQVMKAAGLAAAYGASNKVLNHLIQGHNHDLAIFDELNEEPIMAHKNIETKTFIGGVDASTISDAKIFNRIAELEAEYAALNKLGTSSTKLSATKKALLEDCVALAAYVDGR